MSIPPRTQLLIQPQHSFTVIKVWQEVLRFHSANISKLCQRKHDIEFLLPIQSLSLRIALCQMRIKLHKLISRLPMQTWKVHIW